ncbi:riboflavin kinase [Candidatus Peregrinibacteria bacterium]|nr:riboflavin kinase [Candidatus Peregrinibacteria bacterium]
MHFTAHTIRGAGRGKNLNVPTINLRLEDIPSSVEEGIYAGFVWLNTKEPSDKRKAESGTQIPTQRYSAAIHYGPRPVFNDDTTFEIHILDEQIGKLPKSVTVQLIERLRDIEDFDSADELRAQIEEDIAEARAILKPSTH